MSTQKFLLSTPIHQTDSFRNKQAKIWYETRRSNEMLTEREIGVMTDHMLSITPLFERIGWEKMLRLETIAYPSLVCEFYANMLIYDGVSPVVETIVQGVPIKLDKKVLGQILEIESDAPIVGYGKHKVFNDACFPGIKKACEVLKIPLVEEEDNDLGCKIEWAKPRVVVADYVLAHNVTPKWRNQQNARLSDIYHLFCMFGASSFCPNLPVHILYQMIDYRRTSGGYAPLIFPLVLSQVFYHFRVPLPQNDDDIVQVVFHTTSDMVLRNILGLRKDDLGNWLSKEPPKEMEGLINEALKARENDYIQLDPPTYKNYYDEFYQKEGERNMLTGNNEGKLMEKLMKLENKMESVISMINTLIVVDEPEKKFEKKLKLKKLKLKEEVKDEEDYEIV